MQSRTLPLWGQSDPEGSVLRPTIERLGLLVQAGLLDSLFHRAAGYSPDELILDPTTEEALDTLVSTTGTSDYVFGPGSPAGSIFGLRKHVSTSAAAPVVADASAVGRRRNRGSECWQAADGGGDEDDDGSRAQ